MSGAARCSQDWGHGMERMHGFPSVTFYPKVKLFSHDPLTQDMDCLLALWRLLFLVIPLVTVVIRLVFCSLPDFIFHLKLPCITIYKWKWKWSCCRVRLFMTPWTAAYQAPPSMGFSRQEYWNGVPLPSPIYKLKQTWIKHPCSTRDLGPPCPSFPFWLVLWSVEVCQAHFPARAFKTSSRERPVPLWAVQALF